MSGWPAISSVLYYDDAEAAIDWLCRAFGFSVRSKYAGENGRIEHSELTYGQGVIMVASPGNVPDKAHNQSPKSLGGANTQALLVLVEDVDGHCEAAKAAGARITRPPTTDDHGAESGVHRSYGALDIEGHQWWFMREIAGPR